MTLKRSSRSLTFSENCRKVRGSRRMLRTRLGVLLLNRPVGRSGNSRYRIESAPAREGRAKKSGTAEVFRLFGDGRFFYSAENRAVCGFE